MVRPKKNPFKVSQVRAIKSKKKAKVFTTELKKLTEIVKQKVADVDEQYKSLQETVLKQPAIPVKTQTVVTDKAEKKEANKQAVEEFKKSESNTKEALDKLDNMELSHE